MIPAAEYTRLCTWIIEITVALLASGAQPEDRGMDVRLTRSSGLCICKRSGAWFIQGDGRGGYSPIKLIERLKTCGTAEAVSWAQACKVMSIRQLLWRRMQYSALMRPRMTHWRQY
jgi:hypothetical protein